MTLVLRQVVGRGLQTLRLRPGAFLTAPASSETPIPFDIVADETEPDIAHQRSTPLEPVLRDSSSFEVKWE